MRVLLAPHGTRGDVEPMLALADALVARGHEVAFVVPANFVASIRSRGFQAASNGIDVEAVLTAPDADLHSMRWQHRHLSDLTAQLFASLTGHSGDADLIVGAGIQLAASSVAEQRDIPYASVVFCPCAVPSRAAPPPAVKRQTLPRWVNRLLWDVAGPVSALAMRSPINRGRAQLGLRPLDNPLAQIAGDLFLVAADRDLAPMPDDAPARAVATDAWIAATTEPPLDARLASFLSRDPPPVYVGFGSMVAARAGALARDVVAAVRAVGRGVLVGSGWADLAQHLEEDDEVLVARAVPHATVFPRVAAVIHHGGAGTTTAAAAAGVPQIVLPHILDQFYWAHRIAQLGLGPRGLPVQLVTADIVAERLDDALSDPRYGARAADIGRAVRGRNGAPAAVERLERLVSPTAGACGVAR